MAEQKEFDKQVAKVGFQSANAKYMGYETEPKSFKTKEKVEKIRAKVRFLVDGKDKENKFLIFSPIKSNKSKYKSETELKQFHKYNIVWTEKENSFEGREWVDKIIQCLNDVKEDKKESKSEDKVNVVEEVAMSDNEVIIQLPDDETLNDIIELYNGIEDKTKCSVNHFIGTIIATLNPHILTQYAEIFNTKIKK